MFVYEFLYAGNRLKISLFFFSAAAAANSTSLCPLLFVFNACYAYQLLLGAVLLFPLWRSSPPGTVIVSLEGHESYISCTF